MIGSGFSFGLGATLGRVAARGVSALSYVKDSLKVYFDFNSSTAKTLEFIGRGSAYFDGTGDYIEVEHDMQVDTNYGTVMFWMKRLSMDTVDYFVDFRGTDNDNTPSGSGILYSSSSSGITVNSYSSWYQRYVNGAPTNNLNHSANKWVHICVTGMDLKITENGFNIGARYDNGSNTNMYMKNFAVWERDLSPEEVVNIMHKTYDELKATEKIGLKAWYALESNANDSHNTYHGGAIGDTAFSSSIYGDRTPRKPRGFDNAPTAQADLIGSGSLSLTASSYHHVNVGKLTELDNIADFSIACWIKAPSTGGTHAIWSNFKDDNEAITLLVNGNHIMFQNESGSDNHNQFDYDNVDDEWHHIAVTYDGSGADNAAKCKMYLDGALQANDFDGTMPALTDDLSGYDSFIGRRSTSYSDCNIAQLGIWTRVITQEEIQSIKEKTYSDLSTSEKTTLLSWWGLDSSLTGQNLNITLDSNNTTTTTKSLENNSITHSTTKSTKITADALTEGKVYKIVFTKTNVNTLGYCNLAHKVMDPVEGGSTTILNITSLSGTLTFYYRAAVSGRHLTLQSGGGGVTKWTGTIDNISVEEYNGNPGDLYSGTSIVSNELAADFANSPQKTGEPLDLAKIYSGKGLEFDGVSDYIAFTEWEHIASTSGNFTVAFWVNAEALPSNNYQTKLFVENIATPYHGLTLTSSGTIWSRFRNAANSAYEITNTTTNTVTLGNWHRIVATWEYNTAYKVYFDGVLDLNMTEKHGGGSFTGFLTSKGFGKIIGTEGSFKMSDVQLWAGTTAAWSLADVQYDYKNPETLVSSRAGTSVTTSNLVRWYPMNDTGLTNLQTVVFDAAGTNNTTKNHATTTFYGDNLVPSDESTFESTATEGDVDDGWVTDDQDTNQNISGSTDATGNHRTGSQSFRLTMDDSTGYISYRRDDYEVGKTYLASAWVKRSGLTSLQAHAGETIRSETTSGTLVSLNSDYQEVTVEFTATNAKMYINFEGAGSAGVYSFLDDFTIKEKGIASGWTDADQQQTIPQTALMNGSVKGVFDGVDDGVNVGDLTYLNNVSSFTLSMWVFAIDTDNNFGLFSKFKDADENITFKISYDNIYVKIDDGASSYGTATGAFADENVWKHVVLVYDGSQSSNSDKVKIYVNNTNKTISFGGSAIPSSTNDLSGYNAIIGDYVSEEFSGIIDDVSIFSSPLSASEVSELYNNGLPLNATKHSVYIADNTKLKGYWKNNVLESTGKWKDHIGSAHGTVTGLDNTIFFQEGITANLDTQGFSTTINHPSNGAVWFSGSATTTGTSSYIDIGRDIEIEGDFMVMLWFKVPNTSINYLFGHGNDDYFRISDEDTFVLRMDGTNETIDLESGTDIGVEQWHHIAITRNGASGTIKIYFDNVAQTTDTEESTKTLKIRTLMRKGTASGNYGYGMIDEFFIYDNFDENTISKNYNHGKSKHKNN